MPEKNLQKKATQELILGSLLESSKTTGELAIEIKPGNPEYKPRYNMIYRALRKLDDNKYIEGHTAGLGKYGRNSTLYSLIFSIQNLSRILKEYPHLLSKMQKNNSIPENIFSEYSDLIYDSNDMEYLDSTFGESAKKGLPIKFTITNTLGSYSTYDSSQKDWVEHTEDTLFEKTKQNFKEKLQLSPEFFILFLTNDKNKLITDIKKLVGLSENVIHITSWEYLHNPNNWMAICGTTFSINIAFEACVSMDMLKGQSNREAIEYLRQTKNEISDAEIQRLRNYYRDLKDAPSFLKGKKLISIENPKLEEIEREFEDNGGRYTTYHTFNKDMTKMIFLKAREMAQKKQDRFERWVPDADTDI
jgi:hypothetical protein